MTIVEASRSRSLQKKTPYVAVQPQIAAEKLFETALQRPPTAAAPNPPACRTAGASKG